MIKNLNETIISGIIVSGLAVACGALGFSLILWMWQDFQDWRDKRKTCYWCGGNFHG
jgi:uncharacterized membrane protein YdcZ (DUF606 family)